MLDFVDSSDVEDVAEAQVDLLVAEIKMWRITS